MKVGTCNYFQKTSSFKPLNKVLRRKFEKQFLNI